MLFTVTSGAPKFLMAFAASTLITGGALAETEKASQGSTAASEAGGHGHTYGGSGESTIVSSVAPESGELAVGKSSKMILTLKTKDGKPVIAKDDLDVMHTEPIHLLIVDPSLADYHHIHPPAGKEPGTYVFDFTPKQAGTYNVYSDLHPKSTGIQEYSFAQVKVSGPEAKVKKAFDRSVTVNGYTFDLKFDDPKLVQGKATGAKVTVTGPDGKPFDKLEPLMGAFAHMVGFSEDRQNVAHIHPLGKEPEKATERGGPELAFHVGVPHPGYHVLYVQVQINGRDVFAPFGVEVAPRELPTDAKGIMSEVDEAVEKLDNVANFGPLHKVHELAFAARDLMVALPERAKDLDSEKKAKLDTSLKRVKSLAGLLDKYGDNKDQEQTKALMPRFKAEVAAIHQVVGTTAKGSGEVKVLGNAKCPVSGMAVGSMEAGAALVYNGTKVGLCCNGCTSMFMKDAEAGLKKAQESAKQ